MFAARGPLQSVSKASYADDFNRANTTAADHGNTGNWLRRTANGNNLQVISNQLVHQFGSVWHVSSWETPVLTNDMKASALVVGGIQARIYIRANNGQSVIVDMGGGNYSIYAATAGTFASPTLGTAKASGTGFFFSGGETISFEVTGNVYTAKRTGSSDLVWTDTSSTVYGAYTDSSHRQAAIGVNSPTSNTGIDNWTFADL